MVLNFISQLKYRNYTLAIVPMYLCHIWPVFFLVTSNSQGSAEIMGPSGIHQMAIVDILECHDPPPINAIMQKERERGIIEGLYSMRIRIISSISYFTLVS